jgi:hypothetical protein
MPPPPPPQATDPGAAPAWQAAPPPAAAPPPPPPGAMPPPPPPPMAAVAYAPPAAYTAAAVTTAGDGGYPVQLTIREQTKYNRLFAIPLLGFLIKVVIVIPQLIVLWVLLLVFELLQLVTWIPVLFGAKYPSSLHRYVTAVFRWSVRVQAFFWGLTDRYPPFSFK